MGERRHDSREALVAGATDLVAAEARRHRVWRMQPADLRQAGMVGLLVAADRFDPDRGIPFRAFAAHWVRKEIQRAVADQEFAVSVPATLTGSLVGLRGLLNDPGSDVHLAAAALGISPATAMALYRQLPTADPPDLDGVPDGSDGADPALPGAAFAAPEDVVVARETSAVLRAALVALDGPQREALTLRYGLDGGPERSLREVARMLGCSAHTVADRVERGRRRLRDALGFVSSR